MFIWMKGHTVGLGNRTKLVTYNGELMSILILPSVISIFFFSSALVYITELNLYTANDQMKALYPNA